MLVWKESSRKRKSNKKGCDFLATSQLSQGNSCAKHVLRFVQSCVHTERKRKFSLMFAAYSLIFYVSALKLADSDFNSKKVTYNGCLNRTQCSVNTPVQSESRSAKRTITLDGKPLILLKYNRLRVYLLSGGVNEP